MASRPEPATAEWLASHTEEILDPGRAIVDPHHHLWPDPSFFDYELDQLREDTGGGHNVVATVFVECHAAYRGEGPEELRCVGETAFVAERAAALRAETPGAAPIAGIVAHADLRLEELNDVLDAHVEAGDGLFRGIRDALSSALEPEALMIPGNAPAGLAADEDFRRGVRRLGERGLTYESWQYHHQLGEFLDLARSAPDTTIILDHLGTPLGVGSFAGRRDEIFENWRTDIAAVAGCENVVVKLGGMAMVDNGFGWHTREMPPTSDEFVDAQRRYYEHAIECFGPERAMFESNFPVDKLSISYPVLWNGFKKIAAQCTDAEQDAMFSGTATRTYGLEV